MAQGRQSPSHYFKSAQLSVTGCMCNEGHPVQVLHCIVPPCDVDREGKRRAVSVGFASSTTAVSVLALVALNTSLHIILVTVQSRLSWDQGTHGYLEPAPGLLSRELSKWELLSGSLRFCQRCGIFSLSSCSPSPTTSLSHLLSQFSAVTLKPMVSTQALS